MDPNLGEDVINAPLIDDTDIVTELWYSATGESAPSLPTAGPSIPMQSPATTQADPAEGASASFASASASASASAKRPGGEQEERSKKRLEMSPTKGQKRPVESGGETSKAKDSRAASAQASKGIKRPPENERPDDIDTCLMNLIMEDRDKYLQSIEGVAVKEAYRKRRLLGQGVVSLSSGESEYYALVSGASNLLGEVSTAKDWGLQPESEVFMDASAGIAMGSRRGLGKAKHVDTQYHWVQDRVAKRYFRLKKVAGVGLQNEEFQVLRSAM
eukprot:s57_g32.t1